MRTVAVLLHHATRLFDYGVIHEVFGVDRTDQGVPRFDLWRCTVSARSERSEPRSREQPHTTVSARSERSEPRSREQPHTRIDRPHVHLRGGVTLAATHGPAALAGADLVLVPGTEPAPATATGDERAALRAAHDAGVPIAALCGGAFLVADAGLLDGARATTHWSLTRALAARHPSVTVVTDPLWIEEGGLWTSAGTAAGIDLCLHLVRRAHGAVAAAAIARDMVTPPHRDGGQAQYVERGLDPLPDALTEVLAWARDSLHHPLTVSDLARRARQSPRTFARRFAAATGTTPLRWLHHQRVLLAQELLERTGLAVEEVARRAGFGTTAVLRRHFARDLGTTPSAYRARFSVAAPPGRVAAPPG